MTDAGLSVGVDVGGTFTDLAAIAPDGAVRITKVLTQPRDRFNRVTGMQAGEHQVSGERCLDGNVHRLPIPHLSDEQYVRVLAK